MKTCDSCNLCLVQTSTVLKCRCIIDAETEGSTRFRNPRARGCSARALKGPTVSKSRRSRRSKRLTYLEYATNTATTAQLSNQDEDGTTKNRAIQIVAGRRRNFCLLCEKFTPIRGACPKRSSAPLSAFEGSRAKGKTRAINGKNRVSRNSR